jgi:hypothetical protein
MKEQKKELLAVILIVLGFILFVIIQDRNVDNWNKTHPAKDYSYYEYEVDHK